LSAAEAYISWAAGMKGAHLALANRIRTNLRVIGGEL
jgi:hypothetical protein